MLSAGWLILAVVLAVLVTTWVTFTLTRLDRLHARVDAAQASLDAQLVRRVAAVTHVVETDESALAATDRARFQALAHAAVTADRDDRQAAENLVGRAVIELVEGHPELPDPAAAELAEAAVRVLIARRFYNDAVRDTRALRERWMPRLLHLGARRPLPQFFDIDDTVPVHSAGR
jgi:hypothetical protein